MKKHLSIFAIVFSILLVGCNREHIDGRSITSYSIETNSEADREAIVNDFVTFLGDSGLKKAASPGTDTSGFKTLGENTELWKSASAPYTITISKNPNPKYLSGDISWKFRGSNADWMKLESEIQQFQRKVVDWFKMRPDVIHKESSYWDASMNH